MASSQRGTDNLKVGICVQCSADRTVTFAYYILN